MAHYPSVSIIIPVFNRLELTIECLNSLKYVKYPNYNIIIVDDASTDGTSEYISKHYSDVVLIYGDGNQWYSGGMNLGINKAFKLDSEYLLFLNNDNTVAPDFLSHLVDTAKQHNNTIICSLVYYGNSTKTIRFGGGQISNWLGLSLPFKNKIMKCYIDSGTVYKTDYAGGMGVLINHNHLRDIGLFDFERFPMCGDGELWLRATRNKHYQIVLNPRAIVYGSIGHGNFRYRTKYKQIFKSLFDMRSGNYYKYIIINYYRYFPKSLLVYYLFIRYFFIIIAGLTFVTLSYMKRLIAFIKHST